MKKFRLPINIPKYDIPDEISKNHGEGAMFLIGHEEYGNPSTPLKLIFVCNAATEKQIEL